MVLAACATPTATYLQQQEGYRISQGFVIRLDDLHSPKILNLKDGVSYTVTEPGCTVTLEGPRGQRTFFELKPGDIFIKSQPFSYVLQQVR